MTNYVRRLVYISDNGLKVNPLIYPFLFAVLVYGLGFTFFGEFYFVNSSSLYQSFAGVHDWLPVVWGAAAFLTGAAAFAMLLLRRAFFGGAAVMAGFLVWLFAALVYALNGYMLVFLTVSGPNLFFWVWYYFSLKWYLRQKKAGLLQDSE